jgi:phosphatidylcholine synthase
VCALLATIAVFEHNAERVFWWLAVAFFIDGIDGTIARAVRVKERLPRFSGDRLDLIVDYITYVFVPVLALLAWHHLDGAIGVVLGAGILLSSLYHFSDTESKTKDNCFVGFPAIWNIVAYYIFALQPANWLSQLAVAALIGLTFVPMPWVHPVRVETLRMVTLFALTSFCAAVLYNLYYGFPASPMVQAVILAVAAYGIGLAVVWWLKAPATEH